jgi:hypothetical protein
MKALSVRQPWAFAIVMGFKPVENRTWFTAFRGPLLIHAGKAWGRAERADLAIVLGLIAQYHGRPVDEAERLFYRHVWFGALVGRAVLQRCVDRHSSPWFAGPWGFVLERAEPVVPVTLKGALGFFEVPDEIARELRPAANPFREAA